jgi:hypothetical protein
MYTQRSVVPFFSVKIDLAHATTKKFLRPPKYILIPITHLQMNLPLGTDVPLTLRQVYFCRSL